MITLAAAATVLTSCRSHQPREANANYQALTNMFVQMGALVITSFMQSSRLSPDLQDFYQKHDRWPTNAAEFVAYADPRGSTNTTTRYGEFVLSPLDDGRLEASLVRTNGVSHIIVERPSKP